VAAEIDTKMEGNQRAEHQTDQKFLHAPSSGGFRAMIATAPDPRQISARGPVVAAVTDRATMTLE
jgi:hypothetical protein